MWRQRVSRLRASVMVLGLWAAAAPGARAHEGHQPLPTQGVQVDLASGLLTLSRSARRVLDVQTAEVIEGSVESTLRAYATVVAPWTRQAYVSTRLPGRLVAWHVQPGEAVRSGQLLGEVESLEWRQLRLEYQEAVTQRTLTAALLESLRPTAKSGAVPRQRLLETEAAHRQHEHTVRVLEAKARLLGVPGDRLAAMATAEGPVTLPLLAPLAGVVGHLDVAVGEAVETTQHLLEIVDPARVWVRLGVLEHDLSRVGVGHLARLTFPGRPGRALEGTVVRISPQLDPVTHEGTAWVDVTNDADGPGLAPGMTAVAEVVRPARRRRGTVPLAAVFSDGAERFLLVEATATKEGSEYRRVPVVTGARSRYRVEIESGQVFPGDRVVTRGGHELAGLFFTGVLRPGPETARAIGLEFDEVRLWPVETVLAVEGRVDIPATHRAAASAALGGTIGTLHVDRGDRVQKGALLAEVSSLEFHDLQLELLRAHGDARLWRETLTRLEGAADAVTRRQVLEATSRVTTLEARVRSLGERLESVGLEPRVIQEILVTGEVVDSFPVRAPLAGVVVDFDRVPGQVVRPNEPLFEVHDATGALVQGFVSEREAGQTRVGQVARVRLVAAPGLVLEGQVSRVAPGLDPQTRLQSVWLEFSPPGGLTLRHGQAAASTLTVERSRPVVTVPRSAVVREGSRSFVFVEQADGTLERRRIEEGRADDLVIQVTRGLVPGDRIAIRGAAGLQAIHSVLK